MDLLDSNYGSIPERNDPIKPHSHMSYGFLRPQDFERLTVSEPYETTKIKRSFGRDAFQLFFFFLCTCFNWGTEVTVHTMWLLFTHCFVLFTHFSVTFSLKMVPTTLFKHLKIILLQCFQFSIFSKNKLYPNEPSMFSLRWYPRLEEQYIRVWDCTLD